MAVIFVLFAGLVVSLCYARHLYEENQKLASSVQLANFQISQLDGMVSNAKDKLQNHLFDGGYQNGLSTMVQACIENTSMVAANLFPLPQIQSQ